MFWLKIIELLEKERVTQLSGEVGFSRRSPKASGMSLEVLEGISQVNLALCSKVESLNRTSSRSSLLGAQAVPFPGPWPASGGVCLLCVPEQLGFTVVR